MQLAVTQEVDYALIVCRKQSDRVFEEEHEGCVDHTIRQFVGIDLVERWGWRQNVMKRQLSAIHSDAIIQCGTHVEIE